MCIRDRLKAFENKHLMLLLFQNTIIQNTVWIIPWFLTFTIFTNISVDINLLQDSTKPTAAIVVWINSFCYPTCTDLVETKSIFNILYKFRLFAIYGNLNGRSETVNQCLAHVTCSIFKTIIVPHSQYSVGLFLFHNVCLCPLPEFVHRSLSALSLIMYHQKQHYL